jgi:hypothetical protein
MNYPESETLSIKRLKVAIEKRNWELFERGLVKAKEIKSSGYKFKSPDLWQELLLWSESEDIPPTLWDKFSDFVESVSESATADKQNSVIENAISVEGSSLINKDVVIVYNQFLDKNILSQVRKYRINLNNVIYNSSKFNFEHKWIEELSRLISEFDKQNDELRGFISLASLFKGGGAIITNSYSNLILKMLSKSGINFIYPGIKHELNQKNSWEFYALGGSVNSFICSSCGNKFLKTDFSSRTLAECCNKCSGPMYPNIACIGEDHSEVYPQVWYNSFNRLVSSKMWIVINPPSHNEQISFKNLLVDAARNSAVEEIYVISNKYETFDWWRSKLANNIRSTEIKGNYTSIVSLLEFYNKIMSSEKQPAS